MASEACCAAGAPVQFEYAKKGGFVDHAGKQVYITGTAKRCILVIYDIFGFSSSQVFQVCDRLASTGYTVAAPDVFDGKPWPLDDFPPADGSKFMDWVQTAGDVETTAQLMLDTKAWLESSRGCNTFVTVGFCWGGSVSLYLAASAAFRGNACCHPAFFGKEKAFAQAAANPVCILPAKDDPMEDIKEIMDSKPVALQCFYHRFDDQVHGFMAARGDYSNENVAKAAGEGIKHLVDFFAKCMPDAAGASQGN